MRRLLATLAALFFVASPALAQSGSPVKQSGNITPGSLPYWVTNGVIGGGVSAADSPVTSFGVTTASSAGSCVNSARQSTGSWQALCMGFISGVPTISTQNYGTAPALGLNFDINGTIVGVPTGGGTFIFGNSPFTSGDLPTFTGTTGVLVDSGIAASAGVFTTGVWHATPVAVAFGGTGATTQAGAQANLGLGTMALQNSGAVAITGGTITGLPTPTNPSDAAIKSYVDANSQGLIILASSRLATAAVLPNTPTYNNGSSGVGATLTAGSNTTLTVDSTVANLNDVILVQNQASAFQNGIYMVTTAGDGSHAWVLTRATYFNAAANMLKGSYTFITAGTVNVQSSWVLQATTTTVGTTAVNFAQFGSSAGGVASVGGATGAILLGNGLSISGSTVSTSGGVLNNVLNSQTSNYTIASSDCGSTVQAGTGSTGLFTVTLPSVGGFSTTCKVKVCNGDSYSAGSSRGKLLSGFPAPWTSTTPGKVLWPLQCTEVSILNGAWATTYYPGQWNTLTSAGATFQVNHASGSDTTTDCLGTGAGACATYMHCLQMIQTAVMPVTSTLAGLTCAGPAAGESFTEDVATRNLNGAQNFITFQGTPSTPSNTVWTCTSICMQERDWVAVPLNGYKMVAPGANATGIDGSNYAVIDASNMEYGAFGTNSTHIQLSTGANFNYTAGTYVVSGNATNHINMLQGAGTFSVTAQPTQGTGCSAAGVCFPNATTYTNFLNMSAGWYVTSSAVSYVGGPGITAKKYLVQFGASLYLNGATLPGGTAGTVTDSANNRAQLIP
jgi:hypothetical protein